MKPVRPLMALVLLLSACTSFTPIRPPQAPAGGAQWRIPDGFKLADPADARIPSDWWQIYGDADLDSLEGQVVSANQNLAQADAQYRQAVAITQDGEALTIESASTVTAALVSAENGPASTTMSLPPFRKHTNTSPTA